MIRLISNFRTSQPEKQIIKLHILPNISRIKGKQLMKFDQLIEHSKRNIFLEISFTKFGVETILRAFSKKINMEDISGSIL